MELPAVLFCVVGHPICSCCIVFIELWENWEIPLTCSTFPFISSFQGSIFCSCLHTRVRCTRKVNLTITEHKKTSLRCKSWISVVCTLRAIKTIWGKLSLLQAEGFSKKWKCIIILGYHLDECQCNLHLDQWAVQETHGHLTKWFF